MVLISQLVNTPPSSRVSRNIALACEFDAVERGRRFRSLEGGELVREVVLRGKTSRAQAPAAASAPAGGNVDKLYHLPFQRLALSFAHNHAGVAARQPRTNARTSPLTTRGHAWQWMGAT